MPVAGEGGIHRKDEETDCQNRRKETGRSSEFGGSGEQVEPIRSVQDSSAGTTNFISYRFECRSAEVASHRVPIAKTARAVSHTSQSSPTKVARRFCPEFCQRDATMDVRPPTGLAGSHHGRQTWGGEQNIPVDCSRRPRMERREHGCDDDKARHEHFAVYSASVCSMITDGMFMGRITAHQRGLLGCRVGEAQNPGPHDGLRKPFLRNTQLDSDSDAPIMRGVSSVSGIAQHPVGPRRRVRGRVQSDTSDTSVRRKRSERCEEHVQDGVVDVMEASRRLVLAPQSREGRHCLSRTCVCPRSI